MSNNNANNNQNNQQRKPFYIEVVEAEDFPDLSRTDITTTQALGKRINKLFSNTFVDYQHCIIYNTSGNGNASAHAFMVELHFKPMAAGTVNKGDTRIRAFKPVAENTNSKPDILAGIENFYSTFKSTSKFQMTDEASQILSEFMFTGLNIDPFKPSTYDQHKAEFVHNDFTYGYGSAPIMVKLINLDLDKLVKKFYGSKRKGDNKKVDYQVVPIRPLMMTDGSAPIMASSDANWVVLVHQIDVEKTRNTAFELGAFRGNSYMGNIITGF